MSIKNRTAGCSVPHLVYAAALLLMVSCGLRPVPQRAAPPDGLTLLNRAQQYQRQGRFLEALSFYRDICLNEQKWPMQAEIAARAIRTLRRGYLSDNDTALAAISSLPPTIRVLLEESVDPIPLHCSAALAITDAGRRPIMNMQSGAELLISADNNSVWINTQRLKCSSISIIPSSDSSITMCGRRWGGIVQVHADNGTTLVVGALPLEEYLEGVLPREMSPSWPAQALMAQAVAARTYALYHVIKQRDSLFDVHATTSSQVYGGSDAATPATHAAIAATRGMVLAAEGNIILALYHANSGGATENTDAVWGFEKPYLTGVRDDFSVHQPGHTWEATMPIAEIQNRLQAFGIAVDSITDIVPTERAASGRVTTIRIAQAAESFLLTGNSFRLMLGASTIKSTRFTVAKKANDFVFTGTGYGHGAGMSQRGAAAMARQGYDFRQILHFYYPGTNIENIYASTPEQDPEQRGRHGTAL